MISKAIVKDGGLFIPNVEEIKSCEQQKEIRVQLKILDFPVENTIFRKAAGLLKNRNIDPLKFQQNARSEWNE